LSGLIASGLNYKAKNSSCGCFVYALGESLISAQVLCFTHVFTLDSEMLTGHIRALQSRIRIFI